METKLSDKYYALINKHEGILKKGNTLFNAVGYVKLMLLLCLAVAAFFLFSRSFPPALIALMTALSITAAAFWIYHIKLNERIDYSRGIIEICGLHIKRINGEWISFEDTGAEFLDISHAYARDLDITGDNSLFQFLNTTRTWHGRQAFANDLLYPAYDREELAKRREAIRELSADAVFSADMLHVLSKTAADPSARRLVDCLNDDTAFMNSRPLKIMLTYAPALTLLFIAAIYAFQINGMFPAGMSLLIIQMIIWLSGMAKTGNYCGAVLGMTYKLSVYGEVMKFLREKNFSSGKLIELQHALNEAAAAIKSLGAISEAINVKHNAILYFILNISLLWDYRCAFFLEAWKRRHARSAARWFFALGEFESLLCFSHLPNVCENACLPDFDAKDNNILEAAGLGHPLIPNGKRVRNDFRFDNNILIISGSNMSGKTTFLRTVGVNIVLARSGGFVCADRMRMSYFNVITSMRVTDDLSDGISTFYAELKRIKQIIDSAEHLPGMMFLIDEIFKGTNSADRLAGAKAVIERLHAAGAAGLISTHDLELCELSAIHERVDNYNFSEKYTDDQIFFDYIIRHGKSSATNARYLMKMIGIIE